MESAAGETQATRESIVSELARSYFGYVTKLIQGIDLSAAAPPLILEHVVTSCLAQF